MDLQGRWLVLLGLLLLQQSLARASQPNIVYLLVDDLGWNDVSWHNSDIISPHLQSLYDSGIKLENHYVQPVCTPTRAALMTGFYPYKIGRQTGIISPLQPTGLTLEKTLLPERLKDLGYATHLVGKWHLGFCDWAYTPTRRGFDTFNGYLLGSQDHYTHIRSHGYDFWDQEEVDHSAKGTYSSKLYSKRSLEIIRNASSTPDKPFFLMMSFQNVHGPHQVPKEYSNMYPDTMTQTKKVLYGMVTAMDDVVGQIVAALKEEGLYDNTIIVFTSDNGAPKSNINRNKPLRGNKGSVWEGGTKTSAFVHSPLLQPGTHKGLFHVTDWYNTLLEAASTSPKLPEHKVKYENDGFSQWKALKGESPPPRNLFVYNLELLEDNTLKGAIRRGQFKYMVGMTNTRGERTLPHLYDIDLDPNEETNLYEVLPELSAYMQVELELLAEQMVPADDPKNDDSGAAHSNGVWTPGWCSISS
ncbi:arylsulfatase B-like [Oratosquilla oratoria]|uniref:arylsulfatase B-like n=1 Tax=Oratosquilla oratoria TaxID=337810 RepID=UPI003F759179